VLWWESKYNKPNPAQPATRLSAKPLGALFENIMNNEWNKIQRSLNEASERLENASNEEQFQSVGLLCRETLISLAQVVYNPEIHKSIDGVIPSKTDAKRMLESFILVELGGKSNESSRKFVKAAMGLTNDLQHNRLATYGDAALCLEATYAVVRVIGVVSNHFELAVRIDPFTKLNQLMPKLLEEMSNDLKGNPTIREILLIGKDWAMRYGYPYLSYYFEDHENLISKFQILENYGFIIDTSNSDTKRYRIAEEFADYLLSI
jgi:hypothetical protein